MRKVLLLTTGGTIASRPSDNGLLPQLDAGQILSFVPEISDLCCFETLALFNLDSTNMHPDYWLKLALAIEDNYVRYDAFVVTHGTDTLAYTAAALSYLIQNSSKPIVLTGSQKSIALRDTDARRNLHDAFVYAADPEAAGVKVVFDQAVMLGTRVRKTHTQSYSAFTSIDYPAVAAIRGSRVIHFIPEKPQTQVCFYHELNPNVAVLKLLPGLRPEILSQMAEVADAVVIEGFGVGGLPNLPDWNFADLATDYLRRGKILVMSTQVQHEGSDLGAYQVGHTLKHAAGMAEAYTMTPEALICKLMWILAGTKDPDRVKELLYTKIDHDIL